MGLKKSESPREIEPITSQHRAGALSTELRELMESKVIELSSYDGRPARTSTVEVIESSDK